MRTSHLFAFGSNPFGKACPGVAEIIVGDPVDILTALMEGTEEDIEAIDQIQGAWHKTLIGLRNKSGGLLHWGLGYKEEDAEDTTAVPLSADTVEEFTRIAIVRELLQEVGLHHSPNVTILESGSICAVIPDRHRDGALPGCVWSETFAELESDVQSHWKPLPGPPGTTYTSASGLSHTILLSTGKSGLDQILGIGDNRYGAGLPKSVGCEHPPSHLSEPIPIEPLCGIGMAGVSAGGSRSAVWSHQGEAWMWGQGMDGLCPVQIPPIPDCCRGSEGEVEANLGIASIAIGDDYDFVLTTSGLVWVRGENQLGQLGLGNNRKRVKDFVPHPFFTEIRNGRICPRFVVRNIMCVRSSTFVLCDTKE